jgi:hypothetical protein
VGFPLRENPQYLDLTASSDFGPLALLSFCCTISLSVGEFTGKPARFDFRGRPSKCLW